MRGAHYLAVLIGLALVCSALCPAQAQSIQIDVRSHAVDYPNVAIDFRVKGANGQDVLNLDKSQIQIVEDGEQTIADFGLNQEIADLARYTRNLRLSDGHTDDLYAIGATIGIVVDATAKLRSEWQPAIISFLSSTQPISDPARISLFVPISLPGQQIQQAPDPKRMDPEGFTEPNVIINYLAGNTMPIREGKTSLYAAVQEAIDKTARKARQRGSTAVVLIVSDGVDAIGTDDTFRQTVDLAKTSGVKLVAFGIGSDKNLKDPKGGFRLSQLVSSTGGMYEHPNQIQASIAFTSTATVTPASLYTIRYQTRLIDDGKPHTLVIRVTLPDNQVLSSQPIPFTINGTPKSLRPLRALLSQYFSVAIPIALLISLLIILLTGVIRWLRHSQSLGRIPTRH